MTSAHRPSDAIDIRHGDALDVLRGLPDASVDAVITDPPYGLSQEPDMAEVLRHWLAGDDYRHRGGGFMGRAWDSFVPGPAVWREAYRVLKPGGHLLCFAGTRTSDLMGISIRLAGFEIRDRIRVETTGVVLPSELAWEYGCLTADAEILTERGWKPGIEVEVGEQVAQWDADTGKVSLAAVERVFRAPWDGPMRVLRTADTDQVLTPNHRVWLRRRRHVSEKVWQYGDWEAVEAGQIGLGTSIRLPVAGLHDGPGVGGADYAALLGWVWTEGGFDLSGSGVRVYQSSVNQAKVDEIAALLDRLGPHKRYDYDRTYTRRNGQPHPHTSTTWYFSGDLADRVRADLPGKRVSYGLLWRMALDEKLAFLDAALKGDGSHSAKPGQRGGWQFYQKHEDDLVWFQTLLALVGQRGKVGMRKPPRTGGAVSIAPKAETELQGKHLRAAQTEHYTGEVWCVSVPTGAFVARRNGKVFITGNSGFPKSLDVGKAIDKRPGVSLHRDFAAHLTERRQAAGLSRADVAERVVGARTGACWNWEHHQFPEAKWWPALRDVLDLDEEEWGPVVAEAERERVGKHAAGLGTGHAGVRALGEGGDITAASTDQARRWSGWGTALKPAFEPIIVARKPLAGTVAQNVLTYGTGALNIDGCRVATSEDTARSRAVVADTSAPFGRGMAMGGDGSPLGRWPSNVVLVHGEGCVPVGTRKVRTGIAVQRNGGGQAIFGGIGDGENGVGEREDAGYADEDGMETVEAWECVEGCPVAEMDAQSGTLTSGDVAGSHRNTVGGNGVTHNAMRGVVGISYADSGGASRFFPTFRYQAKADGSERPSYVGPVCFSDDDCSQIADDMHPSTWPDWARDPKGVCPGCGAPCGPIMHPTVKPVDLMRWLVRLVVPKVKPGDDRPPPVVVDMFAGTGATAEAVLREGGLEGLVRCIVSDKVGAHIPLIEQRVEKYDDPRTLARARRGEKVPNRVKATKAQSDADGHDLFADWAS